MASSSFEEALSDEPLPELIDAIWSNAAYKTLMPLLDAELQRREDQLRDLQTYRNKMAAPILNLPPEITSHIFYHFASLTNSLFNLRWTSLLFVCRTWRDIGLSTPLLWSHLDIATPNSSDMRLERKLFAQLRRAGDWPLTLKWTSFTNYSDRFLDIYDPFIRDPRFLRALTLHASPSTLRPLLERMATSKHLQLEHLVLANFTHLKEPPLEPTIFSLFGPQPAAICVRGSVLATMPRLKTLHLTSMNIDLKMISNLTILRIEQSHDYILSAGYSFTLPELISTLQRCPRLQVFQATIPADNSLEPPFSGTVLLTDMRYLYLTSFEGTCADLLVHLDLPTAVSISLVEGSIFPSRDLTPLISQLRQHYWSARTLPIRSLTVHFKSATLLIVASLDIGHRSDFLLHDTESSSTCFKLTTYPRTQKILRRIVTKALHTLPISGVTHVDGMYADRLTATSWRSLISLLPAVTTVAVHPESSAWELTEALDWFLHKRNSRPLTEIHLDGSAIKFRQHGDDEVDETAIVNARGGIGRVVTYIAEAKARGLPLSSVKMMECAGCLPEGMQLKEIYKHLTEGVYFDEALCNRKSAREDRKLANMHQARLAARFPQLAAQLSPLSSDSDSE